MSPLDARVKLEELISRTEDSLIIYVQTLDDEHIIEIVFRLI